MHILSYSQARSEFRQTMDDVCRDHEPTVVTRQRGEPVVLISLEDYNGLCETVHLMRSPNNSARLKESIDQLKAGGAKPRELISNDHTETETETEEQSCS